MAVTSKSKKLDKARGKNADPLYRLTKVERIRSVDGRGVWHRYIIEGGYAPVTGSRSGTKEQVTTYATKLAEEMNARRFLRDGKQIVIGKPKPRTQ
ncbi:MAG: hypothetical protein AAF384_11195 [Pseudomonadota bacterium]